MSHNLRPRQRNAPADHNYCFVPGLPVYDLRQTPRSYGVSTSFAYRYQAPGSDRVDTKVKEESKVRKMQLRSQTVRSSSKQTTVKRKASGNQSSGSRTKNQVKRRVDLSDKSKRKAKATHKKVKKVEESEATCPSLSSGDTPGTSGKTEEFGKRKMCSACCGGLKRRKTKNCDQERRHSERLVVKNFKLPFEQLPVVVKLHIFKYLTPQSRGEVAVVCKEWASLLQSPRLWSRLDLACFDPPVQRVKHYPNMKPFQFSWFTTIQDYITYKERVTKFMDFLKSVQPRLRSLSFQYDLGNEKDNWLGQISEMLDNCQGRDLTYMKVNWRETPVQPPCMETFCCLFNKVRLMLHLHLRRITKFRKFMEKITKCAPNIQTLRMPFEWSPRSVLLLSRFSHLRSLTLDCYVNLQNMDQDLLQAVLRSHPRLQYLSLEIVINVYSNQKLFCIEHSELQTLNLAGCKGFFLRKLVTPQLKIFRTYRYPWQGSLVARRTNNIPCLYDLLRQGAPLLTHINKHKLHGYWLEFMYEELDSMLERICPCKLHWTAGQQNDAA